MATLFDGKPKVGTCNQWQHSYQVHLQDITIMAGIF